MAVKLRLKRMGAKQKPFYRIVAADSRSPRDGRFIETVGTYNPIKNPQEINIDEEKALSWLSKGAEPTDTVRSLLKSVGITKKFADSKKKTTKKVEKKAEKKETTIEVKKETVKKTTTAKKAPAKKATTTKKTTAKKEK